MNQAYFKIFAYNEKGEVTDVKVIRIENGAITMEEAVGQPKPENVSKEKPVYGR
jgi:hypothetical protein